MQRLLLEGGKRRRKGIESWGGRVCTVLLEIRDGSLDDGGYAGLEGVEDRISSRTEPAGRHTQAGMLFHCVAVGGREVMVVGEEDGVVET